MKKSEKLIDSVSPLVREIVLAEVHSTECTWRSKIYGTHTHKRGCRAAYGFCCVYSLARYRTPDVSFFRNLHKTLPIKVLDLASRKSRW